jgi:spermidine synthase
VNERIQDSLLPGVGLVFDATRVLSRNSTAYQELLLIENEPFGRVLLLDGTTQVTTADEFIYHEMMAHVPIFSHGDVRDVLIIGGGDCGLAEEVLKHSSVTKVVQVELDACVVDVSRRHLAEINGGVFEDARFQLHIGDGAAFIDGLDERFDVVLVDSTDPVGAASKLFTASFYRSVRRCLRPRGILVAQAGVPFVQRAEFTAAMSNVAQAFRFSGCYLLASPSYFGGHLALAWGSEELPAQSSLLDDIRKRFNEAALKLRYYTPEVDRAAFALPAYIDAMMRERVDQQG